MRANNILSSSHMIARDDTIKVEFKLQSHRFEVDKYFFSFPSPIPDRKNCLKARKMRSFVLVGDRGLSENFFGFLF